MAEGRHRMASDHQPRQAMLFHPLGKNGQQASHTCTVQVPAWERQPASSCNRLAVLLPSPCRFRRHQSARGPSRRAATGDGSFPGDVNGQDGYPALVPVAMANNVDTGYWEGTLLLRSKRKSKGDGRKCAIRCLASDSASTTTATICVVVPHGQGTGGKK